MNLTAPPSNDARPTPSGQGRPAARRSTPDKARIERMPSFERLPPEKIRLVSSGPQAEQAMSALMAARVWGFDTESRPTFFKDQTSDGPHVVQLALLEQAWVFQLHDPDCLTVVSQLLAAPGIVKAGFGLREDHKHLLRMFGATAQGLLDLNHEFARRGYRREIGVRDAIAETFGRRFIKSKRIATSNWSSRTLSEAQLVYAANDAWAALKVFTATVVTQP